MGKRLLSLCVLWFLAFQPFPVLGCTAFSFKKGDKVFLGKSFDWPSPYAMVYVNKRNVRKTAMIAPLTKRAPAVWKSKYGSVTFNQAGQDIPTGGINEVGLVVTGLLLRQTAYPDPDGSQVIGQGQWKQYLLDNYSTVPELLAHFSQVQILSPMGRFGQHYMVCDRFGECAVIQFVGGKRYCYSKEALPYKVITNDSVYPQTSVRIKRYLPFGGQEPVPDGTEYLARFSRAAYRSSALDERNVQDPVTCGFEILNDVEIPGYTKWQIVYDIGNRVIYFRTASKPATKTIHMRSLDFSCQSPPRHLDINNDFSGSVNNVFEVFSKEENKALIQKVNKRVLNMNDRVMQVMIQYPDTLSCAE